MNDQEDNETIEQKVIAAMKCLPDEMEQEHVQALIMTIAQAYAPTTKHAVLVILNSAITLQDILATIEEANNSTQH